MRCGFHVSYIGLTKLFNVPKHVVQLLLKDFRLGFSEIYPGQPCNVCDIEVEVLAMSVAQGCKWLTSQITAAASAVKRIRKIIRPSRRALRSERGLRVLRCVSRDSPPS